jgi:hypothetical protein
VKIRTLEVYLLPAILIVLLLLPNLFSFNRGYIVYEPLLLQSASDTAANGFNANLSEYFTNISNPAFTLLILAASYKMFSESPLVCRLIIFIIPLIFSLFLYFYLRKKESIFVAFVG